eukprot:6438834-Prorocentrum_lima.AAC.1
MAQPRFLGAHNECFRPLPGRSVGLKHNDVLLSLAVLVFALIAPHPDRLGKIRPRRVASQCRG